MTGLLTALAAIGTTTAEAGAAAGTATAAAGASAAAAGAGTAAAAGAGTAAAGATSGLASLSGWQIAGLVGSALGEVGGYTSAITSYQGGKAAMKDAKVAAEAAKSEADAEAAAKHQQAGVEVAQAGVEQISGEQEAERRSRQMAHDIGSAYANYAGNGLLVDGSSKDALGSALRTTVSEANSDIGTIRDNAATRVWGHMANAAQLHAGAENSRSAGYNRAQLIRAEGRRARRQGIAGMWQGFGSAALSALGAGATLGKAGAFSGLFGSGGGGGGVGDGGIISNNPADPNFSPLA